MVPAVDEFTARARAFCSVVERADGRPLGLLVRDLALELAEVYAAALRLPDVDRDGDEGPAEGVANEDAAALAVLERKLRPIDGYWEVFDPLEKEKPIECSLTQDLAEIYADVQSALTSIERARDLDDAIWDARFAVEQHWGRHAASALKVLQRHIEQWRALDDE